MIKKLVLLTYFLMFAINYSYSQFNTNGGYKEIFLGDHITKYYGKVILVEEGNGYSKYNYTPKLKLLNYNIDVIDLTFNEKSKIQNIAIFISQNENYDIVKIVNSLVSVYGNYKANGPMAELGIKNGYLWSINNSGIILLFENGNNLSINITN